MVNRRNERFRRVEFQGTARIPILAVARARQSSQATSGRSGTHLEQPAGKMSKLEFA